MPFFIILHTLSANAEDKPPVAVQVQPVSYLDYAQPIQASGILSYKSQQTLAFKTSGPVENIQVEAGEQVTKGQLLARLAPDEIDAQVDEATARVSLARKNLKRYQQLHKNNVLSLEKLQSAETELTSSDKSRSCHPKGERSPWFQSAQLFRARSTIFSKLPKYLFSINNS